MIQTGSKGVRVWHKYLADVRPWLLLLSRASKSLVLLGLVVISGLGNFARIRTEFVRGDFGLDQSWLLGLGYQWQQGQIVGRDTFFTYGPLAQLLVNTAAVWQGSGSILNAVSLSYFFFRAAALVLLVFCLGLIKQLRWTGALFIFLVLFSLNLIVLRPLCVLLCVIGLGRALTDAAAYRRGWAVAVGGLCFASLLFSVDTGFFALASVIGLLLLCLILSLPWFNRWGIAAGLRPRRDYVEILVVLGVTFSLGLFALEIFFRLSSPTYHAFDYLRYSLATLLRYNYAMGIPWMSGTNLGPLFVPILFLVIAYTAGSVLVSVFSDLKTRAGDRAHLLLGSLLAAGFTFKAVLVRSDVEHLASAVVILVFLFVLSLVCLDAERFRQPLGGALLLLFWLTWPGTQSFNSFDANAFSVVQSLPDVVSGRVSLVQKWQQIRSIQVDPHLFVSPELAAAIGSQKIIVNFPTDNVPAMALGKKSLAPVLQSYAAFNEGLQQNYVDALARYRPDLEVIYEIDRPLDGVQTVSRTPLIFKYLAENFKLKTTDLFNGNAVLEPRAAPQALSLTPLAYTREPIDQGFDLYLSQPARCSLVELELLIRYPWTAAFGRPTGLQIKAWNGENQILENNLIAIEPGRSFSTFLYLGRPERFHGLFDDQGRIETRATFDRLSFGRLVFGLFDVYPSQVEVSALRCVQPPNPPVERRAGEVERLSPGETIHLNWYVPADVSRDAFVRPVPAGIFMHPQDPKSELEFGPFIAPPQTCFSTRLTLDPEVARHPEADGVEFSFAITTEQHVLNQQTTDLSPADAAVPVIVAVPAGSPFTIQLETGPRGTFDMDWAIWDDPRLGPCA